MAFIRGLRRSTWIGRPWGPRLAQQGAQQMPSATGQITGVALVRHAMNPYSEGGGAELPTPLRNAYLTPFPIFPNLESIQMSHICRFQTPSQSFRKKIGRTQVGSSSIVPEPPMYWSNRDRPASKATRNQIILRRRMNPRKHPIWRDQ